MRPESKEQLREELLVLLDKLRLIFLDWDWEIDGIKNDIETLSEAQDKIWCDVEALKNPDGDIARAMAHDGEDTAVTHDE